MKYSMPQGIVEDSSGNLFVTDFLDSKIRKIAPDGMVSTYVGASAGYADGLNPLFNRPHTLTIDASDRLYVADTYNHAIRKLTTVLSAIEASSSCAAGSFGAVGAACSACPAGQFCPTGTRR
jgi:serine/threonine-protein kinase